MTCGDTPSALPHFLQSPAEPTALQVDGVADPQLQGTLQRLAGNRQALRRQLPPTSEVGKSTEKERDLLVVAFPRENAFLPKPFQILHTSVENVAGL